MEVQVRILYESPSNRQKEDSFFESFVNLSQDIPTGKWERSEAPDYLLHTGSSRIGLEITALVLDSPHADYPLASIRRSQDGIFVKAASMAAEEGIAPLKVCALFRSDRAAVDEHAASVELLEFVKEQLPHIDDKRSWHYYDSGLQHFGWVQIQRGTINGQHWLDTHRWGRIHQNWVLIDPTAELQGIIAKKGLKIDAYLAKCHECWLLVGVDEWTAPEAVTLSANGVARLYCSLFTRVYFLRNVERRLNRLNIVLNTE